MMVTNKDFVFSLLHSVVVVSLGFDYFKFQPQFCSMVFYVYICISHVQELYLTDS